MCWVSTECFRALHHYSTNSYLCMYPKTFLIAKFTFILFSLFFLLRVLCRNPYRSMFVEKSCLVQLGRFNSSTISKANHAFSLMVGKDSQAPSFLLHSAKSIELVAQVHSLLD